MKYQVRLTLKAEADLEGVLAWFREQEAIAAGSRWVAGVMQAIDRLETFPLRCELADESADLGLEIRQLRFGKRRGAYRILFQVEDHTVHILRVRHGAQDRVARDDL